VLVAVPTASASASSCGDDSISEGTGEGTGEVTGVPGRVHQPGHRRGHRRAGTTPLAGGGSISARLGIVAPARAPAIWWPFHQ